MSFAEAQCLWLAVKIVYGRKVLFGSKIISCSAEESFGGLLSCLEEEKLHKLGCKRFFIEDTKGHSHEVQLDAPLTLSAFVSRAVILYLADLHSESNSSDSSRLNVLQVLMSSWIVRHLELTRGCSMTLLIIWHLGTSAGRQILLRLLGRSVLRCYVGFCGT